MRLRLSFCAAACLLWIPAAGSPADSQFEAARATYRSYRVREAEELYRQLAGDSRATSRDRARARTELARIAWLVDGQTDAAIKLLRGSLPNDPDPCAAVYLYARILNESDRPAQVAGLASGHAAACGGLEPGIEVEAIRALVLQASKRPIGTRRRLLGAARADLAKLPPTTRAGLDAAREALDTSLLAGDGNRALQAWRDYFWLGSTNRPAGFPMTDRAIRTAFLSGSARKAPDRAAARLAQLLVRAGFAEEAGWLLAAHKVRGDGRPWIEVRAYLAMRADLRKLVLDHDRRFVLGGRPNETEFQAKILDVLRRGVRAAGHSPGTDVWTALGRLWGLYGQTGTINGVEGIMIGHAVEVRSRSIVQAGRRGSIRYIALDNMIENSLSAWLWDGQGAPGGWAQGSAVIYQVRPLYARSTLRALGVALGGRARDAAIADSVEASRNDEVRLAAGEIAPLTGLGQRLRLQAIAQVAARARTGSISTLRFAQAFRRLWWNLNLESSILLHEGRHVLDQRDYSGANALPAPELEFRGKLSEIEYSDLPRNALSGIVGTEIDPTSSHGRANARIIGLYRDWITANSASISGFDVRTAPLAQIDKLSDAQIRSVAAAADPERARHQTAR